MRESTVAWVLCAALTGLLVLVAALGGATAGHSRTLAERLKEAQESSRYHQAKAIQLEESMRDEADAIEGRYNVQLLKMLGELESCRKGKP